MSALAVGCFFMYLNHIFFRFESQIIYLAHSIKPLFCKTISLVNKCTIKSTECKEMDGTLGKLTGLVAVGDAHVHVFLKKKVNETLFYFLFNNHHRTMCSQQEFTSAVYSSLFFWQKLKEIVLICFVYRFISVWCSNLLKWNGNGNYSKNLLPKCML